MSARFSGFMNHVKHTNTAPTNAIILRALIHNSMETPDSPSSNYRAKPPEKVDIVVVIIGICMLVLFWAACICGYFFSCKCKCIGLNWKSLFRSKRQNQRETAKFFGTEINESECVLDHNKSESSTNSVNIRTSVTMSGKAWKVFCCYLHCGKSSRGTPRLLMENAKFTNQFQLDDQCVVCLEPLTTSERVVELCCSHKFHKRCILQWSENNPKCPLCIRKIEIISIDIC